MALPKKNKKNINITPSPVQGHYPQGYDGITTPNRREAMSGLIDEHGTMLPKSVLHADLDRGMLDFVKDDLRTSVSGKRIPVIDRILTLQRWGEFSKTWSFSDKDKNVSLPFVVVVRKPDVQPGTNPSLQYTIPDRKQLHYAKVPTWDGNRKGYDVYTIPQPVPVDVIYDIKIVCNRMRELNQFNKVILQKFTSRQAYTFVKGHYIPMILSSVGDESVVDTEDRRYYQQNYQFQLQGFLIDEDEFEVSPAVSRVVTLLGGEDRKSKDTGQVVLKSKWVYDTISTAVTKTYITKVDLKTIRTNNVDVTGITISIDSGLGVFTPVLNYPTKPAMVNPNDRVRVEIIKYTPSDPAWIMFQETIVR
tara:strand:+ start:526 stop:1611 length:1086 start_codon:yes stop_codon:yes gene_type:complete